MLSMISIGHYLVVSGILCTIGIIGIICKRNSLLHILMSIEIALLGVTINFIAFSACHGIQGQVCSLFIMTTTAAEAAIGLAIILLYYRHSQNLDVTTINKLKG